MLSVIETWKTHPKWTDYAISDLGRVKRVTQGQRATPGRILKTPLDTPGYPQVNLSTPKQKHFRVHTLVLETFIGERPYGNVCRHLDGDKTNNKLENICWGTEVENSDDSDRHGVRQKGETNGHAVLSDDDVITIREMYAGGTMQWVLAEKYGVSRSHVSGIVNRTFWRHL